MAGTCLENQYISFLSLQSYYKNKELSASKCLGIMQGKASWNPDKLVITTPAQNRLFLFRDPISKGYNLEGVGDMSHDSVTAKV